jgi:hypothetical protein
VYSIPDGGYITSQEANDPNSAYVKGYYGKTMQGGDAGANKIAHDVYSELGDQPMIEGQSPALAQLNAANGVAPKSAPTMNQRSEAGFGNPWKGPWDFPWGPHMNSASGL